MLGYFSLIGLSRVHGLIGDYFTSLQALFPLNPFKTKHLCATKVAGAHTRSPFAHGSLTGGRQIAVPKANAAISE